MKSYMAATADVERKWYVVDAAGQTLGRLSSEIAKVLRGKNKPIFTPHIDTGDYVIVVNAEKIKAKGFTVDPEEQDREVAGVTIYTYEAYNDDGYYAKVFYTSGTSGVTVSK